MNYKTILYVSIYFILLTKMAGQDTPAVPWISYPTANTTSYGVYHFRHSVNFSEIPEKLLIDLSADNRYEFYVNGKRICLGPAKGDLITYKYDVIDIAPYLNKGKNTLAALVFNLGQDKPMAFVTAFTAFLLRAEDQTYEFLNTGSHWKCYKNPAYDPIMYSELKHWEWVKGYYACGPGDEVYANKYPWGWQNSDFDDREWPSAETLTFDGKSPWNLVPRNIALLDHHREQPGPIRRIEGLLVNKEKIKQLPIEIPEGTDVKILIDFNQFTMGYPELTVYKGNNASIKIRYAEALYEEPNLKAHRDSVNGLTMYGVFDIYHCDGERRTFRPLWKRAFRYVELEVHTNDEPLEIISLENEFSGYPYTEMATFNCNDPELNEIFHLGLRTLRMCSGETFYDTPYYEQLCYPGDNRPIIANYLYNTTDDRLLREVIRLVPQSKNRETELFKSAYPSRFDFDMGTWSMAWIQGLWDYYLIRADRDFLKQFKEDIAGVLRFHRQHLDESIGMLGPIDTRNFIDWSIHIGSLPQRRPNISIEHSAMLSLYFALTLDSAVKIYRVTGEEGLADQWEALSNEIKTSVTKYCWNKEKKLFAEYPDQKEYTQHTNILAILCDAIPPSEQDALLDQILNYPEFSEVASSYFSFFLFKAMDKLGKEDLFINNLDFWHDFITKGFTTFGETGFASHDRSDCHAWSAHPSHFILSLICGIKPGDIGFHTIDISPHPGSLTDLAATIPHPEGRISVKYIKTDNKWTFEISLPPNMNGNLSWAGQNLALQGGLNSFEFP
ncbi:MAG: family 78 glycoside hydrolase catalytic domain [Saprospiraceae bacterium]|nr:family 78 glycoside hydrolase catalytic domain [Saprospiraceae bacterium]